MLKSSDKRIPYEYGYAEVLAAYGALQYLKFVVAQLGYNIKK